MSTQQGDIAKEGSVTAKQGLTFVTKAYSLGLLKSKTLKQRFIEYLIKKLRRYL